MAEASVARTRAIVAEIELAQLALNPRGVLHAIGTEEVHRPVAEGGRGALLGDPSGYRRMVDFGGSLCHEALHLRNLGGTGRMPRRPLPWPRM